MTKLLVILVYFVFCICLFFSALFSLLSALCSLYSLSSPFVLYYFLTLFSAAFIPSTTFNVSINFINCYCFLYFIYSATHKSRSFCPTSIRKSSLKLLNSPLLSIPATTTPSSPSNTFHNNNKKRLMLRRRKITKQSHNIHHQTKM